MMVGMPYPNIKSPELQEKMAYLDKNLVNLTHKESHITDHFSPGLLLSQASARVITLHDNIATSLARPLGRSNKTSDF